MAGRQVGACATNHAQAMARFSGDNSGEVRYIPPPEGCRLETEQHQLLWRHCVMSRQAKDWRAVDLLMLHKFVRNEILLEEWFERLALEGPIDSDRFGGTKVNPMLNAFATLDRAQSTLRAALGLIVIPAGHIRENVSKTERAVADGAPRAENSRPALLAVG